MNGVRHPWQFALTVAIGGLIACPSFNLIFGYPIFARTDMDALIAATMWSYWGFKAGRAALERETRE